MVLHLVKVIEIGENGYSTQLAHIGKYKALLTTRSIASAVFSSNE
jgi:hypothetical protein